MSDVDHLPYKYKDLLFETEIKFENGDYSLDTIRNLLTLYAV